MFADWCEHARAKKSMVAVLRDAELQHGDVAEFERSSQASDDEQPMEPGVTLQRSLGSLQLFLFGVGSLIGSGVFVLTGQVASTSTGPALILSIFIAACSASLSAISYAEIAGMFPVAGSAYTFSYVALGEIYAWMIGWVHCVQ